MSIVNNLTMLSESINDVAEATAKDDCILYSIEIVSGNRYYSGKDENGNKMIEVWLHLRRPIMENECTEFKCIIDNDDCRPDEPYGVYNTYDYHLSYFPKSWMEDIFPRLLSTKM